MVNRSEPLKKGDHVQFNFGPTAVSGVVIDDRGPIGFNKTRIYRVSIPNDPYGTEVIEVASDELEIDRRPLAKLSPAEMVDYFSKGGLIEVLNSNYAGGAGSVWLTRDSLGNLVHTFVAERGITGGVSIPSMATQSQKIFSPKMDEVLNFLRAFGLTNEQATDVVEKVGTTP